MSPRDEGGTLTPVWNLTVGEHEVWHDGKWRLLVDASAAAFRPGYVYLRFAGPSETRTAADGSQFVIPGGPLAIASAVVERWARPAPVAASP